MSCRGVRIQAYKDRSLHELETALVDYTPELMNDDLIRTHLENLKETLLEENLLRLIEPYSWFVGFFSVSVFVSGLRNMHDLSYRRAFRCAWQRRDPALGELDQAPTPAGGAEIVENDLGQEA